MLGSPRLLLGPIALTVAAGCSALINPDPDRLGPDEGSDSGVSLMDSGMTGFDAGPMGFDAGDVPCVEGSRRCMGDRLLTCAGGVEVAQDCQSMSAFCSGDQCEPHVCRPNSRECSADGGSVVSCNARGSEATTMDCGDSRCDPATRTCVGGGGACEGIRSIALGTERNTPLCAYDDDHTFQPDATMCRGMSRADSGDRTFELTLTAPTRVTFELTDVDNARAIDTVLYVRRACDEAGTQVLCADDVPCAASTAQPPACIDGVDVRQSRITADLPAGTYYIVVDAFLYSAGGVEFQCGDVRLRVDRAG